MSNARNIAGLISGSIFDVSTKTLLLPSGVTPPTGSVVPFAGASTPTGWLFCFGQTVSRTTYAALFVALGTTYGAGDGSTTFALPDLRGRVPGGKDNMGGSAANRLTTGASGVDGASLGAAGGAEIHTLSTAQMPAHAHDLAMKYTTVGGAGSSRNYWTRSAVDTLFDGTITNGASSKGDGAAHNNTQPTIVLNYIIKT